MADRDLTIKAKVEGGPEARAQVDGLKDSVEKLGEAQTGVAAPATAAATSLGGEADAAKKGQ